MAIVPFVGSSYKMDALTFSAQRTINMYPILAETGGTKSVSALRGCPGLSLFTTAGTGEIRGAISSTANRGFVVSGNTFYEISTTGTPTSRGTLNTTSGRISISENNTQIMIVDGADGWIFTKATNVFAQITDVDFPTTSFVTFQDGYFIVAEDGADNFYISALDDGTSWSSLDQTSVESSPDSLEGVYSDNGNLWCFGNRSVEVYQNTGNATFPFERIPGAIIQTGCANIFTVQRFDNTIIWLGVDEQGRGVVWMADGYNAKRVSTQAIEKQINTSRDFTDAYAWVYHEQGHIFYVLQIPSLETTLVYDGATREWHERSYYDSTTGGRLLHRGSCQFFFNQKTLVGDREDGKIYEMSLVYQDDAGVAQVRERISPTYINEKREYTYSSFELDFEVGQGTQTGQGSDPQIMLQHSNDGGYTWSSEVWRSLGKAGEYNKRVIWRRLGRSRSKVIYVRISDPVFVQINAAYLNAD